MRKITLDPDTLAVESFEPAGGKDARGTVNARESAWTEGLNGYTCQEVTCNPPSCPAFSCVSQCPARCY